MTHLRELAVANDPSGSRVIAAPTDDTTIVLKGDGGENYICAGCWALLLEGVETEDVLGRLFLCNDCGTVNQVPTT